MLNSPDWPRGSTWPHGSTTTTTRSPTPSLRAGSPIPGRSPVSPKGLVRVGRVLNDMDVAKERPQAVLLDRGAGAAGRLRTGGLRPVISAAEVPVFLIAGAERQLWRSAHAAASALLTLEGCRHRESLTRGEHRAVHGLQRGISGVHRGPASRAEPADRSRAPCYKHVKRIGRVYRRPPFGV
jgi:hypothetical protein